jgi:glycosyltransferase involved in cell wall biosynthesis
VDRSLLPEPSGGPCRFLFVGSFAHEPNLHGLNRFLDEAWGLISRNSSEIEVVAVGMLPPPQLVKRLNDLGIALHSNVPSVAPFYAECHAVIAPIFFGGGTRIKLLEAMAYGRAIVATSLAAEGLDLVHGEHALIADDMESFAEAMIALARSPNERHRLAAAAREHQQKRFSPAAMEMAVRSMIGVSEGPTRR